MNKMKCYNVTCVDNAGNSYKAKIETDEWNVFDAKIIGNIPTDVI